MADFAASSTWYPNQLTSVYPIATTYPWLA